ncbi:3-oxoacyl-[acyl-carrier-protein] reductase [Anaerobacillus isosaccharinicus]|uniref:3-oxoacyl-[acyl-carrier-protein] reductase n=1 Tax=Anaerobacillus isosaccharinicus TaxID=1532552 RepID=A0A1S2L6X9_9BACI|nr:3-oxoacyl-[acyl-carrier-protein] reductase [Anaerobacillus isosaccharinicus]MBA5587373.1 3-oxoacyl-[acyl-carrier-protein] reductase [Anaerobacillus isosaccharinicus]QOY34434.1 3-oxoacyl-[acyl-carrier-protein] reductase [Anaerobacillus isosaccharinicus]
MLKGKSALVTGASRGIGRAIAIELARQGVNVAVNFAGNAEKAEEVVAEIKALGSQAFAIKADVANSEEVAAMVKETVDAFGSLDILVNNAGITRDGLIMRMKEDDWDAVINTNLKGVFNCAKAVTRQMMKQRYGRIINISSVVGVLGNAGQANYVAAKAGVIGLTKTLARELANRNINVNAVAPGFIETDMTNELSEDIKQELLKQIPLAKLGKAEDIAAVVRFLVSEDANYMTGQTLHVDGGMVM